MWHICFTALMIFGVVHKLRHAPTTSAPGKSAFNRLERKMAPLSKELTGYILPHDQYGSHLNERGITIDADLEKKNFKFAGVTLA